MRQEIIRFWDAVASAWPYANNHDCSSCAWPPQWSPPVLCRRFECGICILIHSCKMAQRQWDDGTWRMSGGCLVICQMSALAMKGGIQNTHTPIKRPFSGTTQVSRYQKRKTNLDITETRDSEWQWHQLGHMQVCTSLQTDNHANTSPLSFLQAGCPSCRPTDTVGWAAGRASGL